MDGRKDRLSGWPQGPAQWMAAATGSVDGRKDRLSGWPQRPAQWMAARTGSVDGRSDRLSGWPQRPAQWMAARTGSVDGRKDRLSGWPQRTSEYQVCRDPHACGYHTGFIRRGIRSPMEAAGERSEFDIKSPLGAPLLTIRPGSLLKSFAQEYNSARQRGFEISVLLLLGELPQAIQSHLPDYLYDNKVWVRVNKGWQLGPNI